MTRIRPERAGQSIAAACLEAGADNPWTYIIRPLDQEVGAQIRRGTAGQGAVDVVLKDKSLNPAAPMGILADCSLDQRLGVGTRWQVRSSGEVIAPRQP